MNDRVRIGHRLREIRQANGLTMEQLGEKCGLSHSTISKLENGRWSASIDMLSRVCEALGKKVDII